MNDVINERERVTERPPVPESAKSPNHPITKSPNQSPDHQITRSPNGFTLIELMVVISLIVILSSLGLVQYRHSITYSQEAVLRDDLNKMRDAIDQVLRGQEHISRVARRACE